MAWREIPQSELRAWNQRLLQDSSASIRQYPLFNEGLRGSGGLWVTTGRRFATLIAEARRWTTSPRFLVRDDSLFACIVTIGVPGFRVGCILDGPVGLHDRQVDEAAIRDLLHWARRNNYVALRVTHSSQDFLAALAPMATSERVDGMPFYPHPASELYVQLSPDETTLLSGFQKVARQEVKKAREAAYTVSVDHDPAAIQKVWPVFESRSAQKGISYRELDTYMRMMREAEPHGLAHLYTAWRDDRPVASILILRDRTTAHYFLGAVDTEALGDSPSPACLLQLTAMKEAAETGATFYNLGTRSGSVYAFKAKFRPTELDRPTPLTFAVNPWLYPMWRRLLPVAADAAH